MNNKRTYNGYTYVYIQKEPKIVIVQKDSDEIET